MSKPNSFSCSVAFVSKRVEVLKVTSFVSCGIFSFHKSKHFKSGIKTTLRPFNALVFALFRLFTLPTANQINSGKKTLEMIAVFSLSTSAGLASFC